MVNAVNSIVTMVNINLASVKELQNVPGITYKKSTLIVAHREQYGLYNSINELVQIKGISAKWVSSMESKLTV